MAITLEELKRNVFPGESGGDYNALYGFSNRPDGQFSNVRLTDMTIDEALQFADPSGPYAATVRGQVGRTATPMGAYQIVGSTLRAAKEGLGLTGSERMTPAVQDALGMWIYQNQGPQAWSGWGGGGRTTVSSSNYGGYPMEQEQPGGIAGIFTDPERRARLAMALAGMSLNPNQGVMAAAADKLQVAREQRQANRTAQWLRAQGRDDLASAVETGTLGGREAATIFYTPDKEDRTAMIQNYEYWLSQGKTPDEAAEMARAGAGGTTVNMGTRAEDAFGVEAAKGQATMFNTMSQDALNARADLGRIDVIDQLFKTGVGGNQDAWKAWAKTNLNIDLGTGGAVQALDAMINQLVPSQRPPGSGTMSDKDVALFKSSLPSLINSPEGNAIITQTMRGMAEYRAAIGEIANAALVGEISRGEALQLMEKLPDPMANAKAYITERFGANPPAGGTGAPSGLTEEDLRYLGVGTP